MYLPDLVYLHLYEQAEWPADLLFTSVDAGDFCVDAFHRLAATKANGYIL